MRIMAAPGTEVNNAIYSFTMNSVKIIFCVAISLTLFSKPDNSSAKEPSQSDSATPIPFSARYDLHRGGIKMGETEYSLKHLGENSYLLEGSAMPAGLLALFSGSTAIERSHWKYIDGRIQPVKYTYDLSSVFVNKKMLSIFDWSRLIATVTHNKTTRQVPIKAGDLDHSLVIVAVMLDMKKGKLNNEYRYVDRRRVKHYKFQKIGQEWIQTELGLFKAVLVETIQKSKKRNKIKRRSIFWCVPKLDYLPVRISHQTGDDTEVVMSLTRLRGELGDRLKNK